MILQRTFKIAAITIEALKKIQVDFRMIILVK